MGYSQQYNVINQHIIPIINNVNTSTITKPIAAAITTISTSSFSALTPVLRQHLFAATFISTLITTTPRKYHCLLQNQSSHRCHSIIKYRCSSLVVVQLLVILLILLLQLCNSTVYCNRTMSLAANTTAPTMQWHSLSLNRTITSNHMPTIINDYDHQLNHEQQQYINTQNHFIHNNLFRLFNKTPHDHHYTNNRIDHIANHDDSIYVITQDYSSDNNNIKKINVNDTNLDNHIRFSDDNVIDNNKNDSHKDWYMKQQLQYYFYRNNSVPTTGTASTEPLLADDINRLKQIVMQGLKLKAIPNMLKVNISHKEYRDKYTIYLERIREQEIHENMALNNVVDPLSTNVTKQLFSFTNISHTDGNCIYQHGQYRRHCHRCHQLNRRRKIRSINYNDLVYIRFQLTVDDLPNDIEESTLRLLVKNHPTHATNPIVHNRHTNMMAHISDTIDSEFCIHLKVYQLIEPYGRTVLLDQKTIDFVATNRDNSVATSHWVEFDVSRAIENWLSGNQNLGFEIVCDACTAHGMHIVHDVSLYPDPPEYGPVLNVIGKLIHREKRSRQRQHRHFYQQPNATKRKPRKTDCHKDNRKCCRHTMDVVFKEIKGFEFIIQPKNFDAGYCHGKCPPRYNPAHHHAVLQSLISKQNRLKAPRPCCAPSKLVELEVLHVDEMDSTKLKVSTWSDMRVLECACS